MQLMHSSGQQTSNEKSISCLSMANYVLLLYRVVKPHTPGQIWTTGLLMGWIQSGEWSECVRSSTGYLVEVVGEEAAGQAVACHSGSDRLTSFSMTSTAYW